MKRILIVEDNELNSDMLSRRLQRAGFEVSVALDGSTGLQMAATLVPALIVLDIRLPDIDGREVVKRLRQNEHTRQIPVIALTASVAEADRERALISGCDDFDTKPIDWPRLLGKIQQLIGP